MDLVRALALALWCALPAVAAAREPLARVSTKVVRLDGMTIETSLRTQRDRCYTVVLRLAAGGRLEDVASPASVELFGHAAKLSRMRLSPSGGQSPEICPLDSATARLQIHQGMSPRLGSGTAVLEVWARKLAPAEVRAEAARQHGDEEAALREKRGWQRMTAQSPACDACDRARDRCVRQSSVGDACGRAWMDCRSARRCNAP